MEVAFLEFFLRASLKKISDCGRKFLALLRRWDIVGYWIDIEKSWDTKSPKIFEFKTWLEDQCPREL
jgi:hypothetical protein